MSGDGPRAGLQIDILLYLHVVERENKLGLSSSYQTIHPETSLSVRWFRLCLPVPCVSSIPGWAAKIPQMSYGQKHKTEKRNSVLTHSIRALKTLYTRPSHGSSTVKNLPANAGDAVSIPVPGGSHMQLSP